MRFNLEDDGDEDLFERIDWQVQNDWERFDGASARTLREYVRDFEYVLTEFVLDRRVVS
jgi:hypothetical protein